jgi:2-haloalkanoic acid dehalogenase type II
MMTIKAVLFDLDDTLWPVAPVIQQAEASLYAWLELHAPALTNAFTIDMLRQHRQDLLPTNRVFSYDLWALRHTHLSAVLAEVGEDVAKADEAMQVFAHARNQVQLYDDVKAGLLALHAQLPLGAVSNGFADLEVIGLAPYFKLALSARKFGCAKPDPRIFYAACEGLGVAPAEVLFVGDDLRLDVEGAQRVGMQAAWMNRHGRENQHTDIVPDIICENIEQLQKYISAEALHLV